MDANLENTKMWESVDHSLTSNLLSRITSTVECTICSEIMAVPVTAECGHSFCYDCIYQWFSNKVNCPTCRHEIENKPTLNLQLKEICKNLLDMIIDSRLENHEVLKNHKLESENNYNLDVRNKSLFGDLFNSTVTLIDNSDGVPRCGNCHWEAHGPVCQHCGTRFRVNPHSRFGGGYDDDDDEDEENFQDVIAGYHRELDTYDSEDSFIDSRTAHEIPVDMSDEDDVDDEGDNERGDDSDDFSDNYEGDSADGDRNNSLLSTDDDYHELVLNGHPADEWHGFESASSSMIDRALSNDSDYQRNIHDHNDDDDEESHTQEIEDDDPERYHLSSPSSENIIQLSGNDDDSYYDSEDVREALNDLENVEALLSYDNLIEDVSDDGLEGGYDSSRMVHALEDDISLSDDY
ncbi:RING finger protein PSH1 [Candida viswanathii]|uniref:RING finger protein PSH1 n=1 Tax=Candida viswanathii TaxID=5486 RepID=A0A367XWY6_9ASCO|nr:RING finger protein PSH1 [Candida viswanathii]